MFTFKDLQDEVKVRATLDQGGTQFDTTVKNIINTSLLRVSKEGLFRQLRRTGKLTTVVSYTIGSGTVSLTENSTAVTVTGATFITDGIKVGRMVEFSGSNKVFKIAQITGETTMVLDSAYDGTTDTDATYEILPQQEYNLPIQCDHRTFLWHNQWGYPYKLVYVPEQSYFDSDAFEEDTGIPTHYRMWGQDMVIDQVKQPSAISISSSSSLDVNIPVTVHGVVSGYPDYEVITTNSTNGTTASAGSKLFSSVESVVKGASSTGRITVTANSGNTTVAVLPVGDTTAGIMYSKIKLYPLPTDTFDIYVYYYKQPYRLVNDGDVHELGSDFDESIINLSVAKLNYQQGKKEDGDRYYGIYKEEIRLLRKHNTDKIDWLPTLFNRTNSNIANNKLASSLTYSQIGPNYGPMSK